MGLVAKLFGCINHQIPLRLAINHQQPVLHLEPIVLDHSLAIQRRTTIVVYPTVKIFPIEEQREPFIGFGCFGQGRRRNQETTHSQHQQTNGNSHGEPQSVKWERLKKGRAGHSPFGVSSAPATILPSARTAFLSVFEKIFEPFFLFSLHWGYNPSSLQNDPLPNFNHGAEEGRIEPRFAGD